MKNKSNLPDGEGREKSERGRRHRNEVKQIFISALKSAITNEMHAF